MGRPVCLAREGVWQIMSSLDVCKLGSTNGGVLHIWSAVEQDEVGDLLCSPLVRADVHADGPVRAYGKDWPLWHTHEAIYTAAS